MVDSVQSNPLPLILKLPPNVVYYGILGVCNIGVGGGSGGRISGGRGLVWVCPLF